jgi:hypothetical protein
MLPLGTLGEWGLSIPPSDKTGRLTVPGLIPGATYRHGRATFTVKAGETRVLPDFMPFGGGGAGGSIAP